MATKFMRNYLIKYTPHNGEQILIGDLNWENRENWTYPRLLTMHMDIKRDTFAMSNECHIQVLNLSSSTRQRIFHDRFRTGVLDYLEVYAGYGQNLAMIFRGRVLQSYSYKQGTNMVTDIQGIDLGFMQYFEDGKMRNFSNQTFAEGTTKGEIIKSLVGDMDKGTQVGAMGAIKDGTFQTPFSCVGNTFSLIDNITGGHVFVDMGKVNILSNKEALKMGSVPVISSETGLLGTPMRRDAQLEVDVLFAPELKVGQLVKLETSTGIQEYNGTFKIVGIHHSGEISTAECGTLRTRLNLFTGVLIPNSDIELIAEEQEFSQVENEDVTPVDSGIPHEARDVYKYIQKFGKAPHSRIPETTIFWDMVIRSGKPPLSTIANLYEVARQAQFTANTLLGYTPIIQVSSGFRDSSKNRSVGGSSTSLHLTGRAIDITKVGSLSRKQIYNLYDPQMWCEELLLEPACVHVGIKKGRRTRGYWSKGKFKTVRDK